MIWPVPATSVVAGVSRSVAEPRSLLVRHLGAATLRQLAGDSDPAAEAECRWALARVASARRAPQLEGCPGMGNMHTLLTAPQAASSSGGGSYTFLIIIVVLFGLFYFVMIRPQRNRQRRVQEMQRQVVPGQRVRTTAGMYATVTAIDDDDVTLEVAPGVNVRFMRRAIMDVLPDGDGAATPEAPADGSAAAGGPAAAAGKRAAQAARDRARGE